MRAPTPPLVCFTVDVEPDCPPYLSGFRGIEQGMPALLGLLAGEGVRGTFFTTGDVATRYPDVVRELVRDGHELASHGMTHTAFAELDDRQAAAEIRTSADVLRSFAPVTSFRAPYLRFPDAYVPLLADAAFTLDSSQAKYKRRHGGATRTSVARVPVSVTSSWLRLPSAVRDPVLTRLASPVVLFVHPWEFVDLRRERLRLDCRFRTGDTALACVRDVIGLYRAAGARFVTMRELVA